MRFKYLIFVYIFTACLGVFAVHSTTTAEVNSTVSANKVISENKIPDPVFIDWYQEKNKLVFDILMPYGNNGSIVYLGKNNKVATSSSLKMHPPFAQHKKFILEVPVDGIYEYESALCADLEKKYCTRSTVISLIIKNGIATNEADVPSDDISIDRSDILKKKQHANFVKLTTSKISRLQNTTKPENRKNENILRIKNIFFKSGISSILSNTKDISIEDFYSVASRYPAFCNEADNEESLEEACAKDLSAYFSLLLFYTNDNVKNEFAGINNYEKVKELIGDTSIDFNQNPKEILSVVMDWYMTPKSPTPDAHSILLGLFVPNKIDRLNNIENGFGGVVNAASGALFCDGYTGNKGQSLSSLYSKILLRTGVIDKNDSLCNKQKSFTVGGGAYFPQYFRYDYDSSSCILDIIPTPYNVRDVSAYPLCGVAKDGIKKPIDKNYIENGVILAEEAFSRMSNSKPISQIDIKIDKRINLGKQIIATYPYWRAYDPESLPSKIPFGKINSIIFDGAYISSSGEVKFIDDYTAVEMPFSGDCLKVECKRGVINQFNIAKKAYPNLKIVLGISVDNISNLKNDNSQKIFVTSLESLFRNNPNISGVQLMIKKIENNYESEKLRKTIAGLSTMISTLDAEFHSKHSIYISTYIDEKLLALIPFKDILSMIDGIHILAYDNHLKDEKYVGHNAQIFSYNIDNDKKGLANTLLFLKNQGIPQNKIVIGVPFFGRVFEGVESGKMKDLPGLFAIHNTTSKNTYIDYKTVVKYLLGKGSYQYYEDTSRGAAYIYDGETFVSYDSPSIVEQKMSYIFKDDYSGILISDIMGDDGTLNNKVLSVVAKEQQNFACKISRIPKKNLASGSKGAEVFALQEYLKCLGYIPSHIDINGFYGLATKSAVSEFQKAKGLIENGVVDEKTRKVL